jgi:hypothetical protein
MISAPMQRAREELYLRGLFWILRNRAGSNGRWPPQDIRKVSGWAVVKMLAEIGQRTPRDVAGQIIKTAETMDQSEWELIP